MTHTPFYNAALALALGMLAQTIAARFAIPSIVILLVIGVAVGPDGWGLLDPAVFGSASAELVTLAVTVILFEGGLALRREELRRQQRSLTLLLTLGAAISMISGTWAARVLLGMPWSIAALYGALMIVTGPTVVTPLLSRLTMDRTVRELLISEGVLIDPVGAIVAIVAAEYVLGRSLAWETGWLVFVRLGVGAVIGAAAGLALAFVLRRHWVPDSLRNPTVLGAVLLAAALASRLSSEAGLMAAVTQGVVMANAGLPELGRLRQFKEELTVLLLSFIFILLAADLSVSAVRELGWRALLVVGVLIWVARPLSVFLCTVGSGLTTRQRLFIAWICPRGIVAASVAGLFGILLNDAQVSGGEQLEALVFVTVGCTVALQGLTARPIARLLGVDVPSLRGTIIVGADAFGRLLGRLLLALGRQVVLVDLSFQHCRAARAEGLSVYNGDALSVENLEEAGARYADTVVAVTRNQELNTLVGQRVRDNFRVERVLAVSDMPGTDATSQAFPGHFPGLDEVNRQLQPGRARLIWYHVRGGELVGQRLGDLPFGRGEFALLLQRRDRVYVATNDETVAAGDHLLCVTASRDVTPLHSHFTVVGDADASDRSMTWLFGTHEARPAGR
ncbi:MAG: cation:proton antiporter [Candidatus Binatia bacterium]